MKKLILAAALMAVASLAVASFASAGVSRYQTQSMTLTRAAKGRRQWDVWTHTYNVTVESVRRLVQRAPAGQRHARPPQHRDDHGTLNGDNTISYTGPRHDGDVTR